MLLTLYSAVERGKIQRLPFKILFRLLVGSLLSIVRNPFRLQIDTVGGLMNYDINQIINVVLQC